MFANRLSVVCRSFVGSFVGWLVWCKNFVIKGLCIFRSFVGHFWLGVFKSEILSRDVFGLRSVSDERPTNGYIGV